ncbi:MAG: hypothetical protein HOC77_00790 [Chloroflexi bacterium]|nr:hypothetical protein [Chloroflexota bacterium]MBT4513612.1 hypothetical protein [Chloroflexota bacterium]
MRFLPSVLMFGLVGIMAACGSAPSSPVPASQPTSPPFPSVIATPTASALSAFVSPRATVTAFFEEHDPPYQKVYRHHLTSALWAAEFASRVYMSGWDEVTQRFIFEVLTEKTKSAIEARAAAIGIPDLLLDIEVRTQATPHNPPVKTTNDQYEISFEFGDNLRPGEATEFTIVIGNNGPDAAELTYNSAWPADVVVFSLDGVQLWRHFPPLISLSASAQTISPGESLRFPVEWKGQNDDGDFLPAGDYLVRAFTEFDLATAAIRFSLAPAP